MSKILKTFLLLLSFSNCTQVNHRLDPNVIYKRDLILEVNGQKGEGVLIVNRAASYKVKVKSKGKIDLFILRTCHREVVTYPKSDSTILEYKPIYGLEAADYSCSLMLSAFEISQGRHAWGFVDFTSDGLDLPANLQCNGELIEAQGVSICQSKNGLYQQIIFSSPVLAEGSENCAPLKTEDDIVFSYPISKGFCIYRFKEKNELGREHRLTTIGYEMVPIR